MHHQYIFNASIMHHQRFINALSMHSSTHHQGIVSEFVNASSMYSSMHHQCIYQYTINTFIYIPSIHLSIYHQFIIIATNASISFIQFFLSFIKFIHISSFALLFGHSLLWCCHPFHLLLSFLHSLYPFNSFFRPSLRSFAVRYCIQSSTIILFLCLANSWFNTLPTRSLPCCVNSQFYALEKKSTMLCNLLYHHASVFERTNQRREFSSKHAQDKPPNQPGNGRSRYAFDAISSKR